MPKAKTLLDEVFQTANSVKELFLCAREEVDELGDVSAITQERLNRALREREFVVTELADWHQHTAATLEGLRAQYKPILDRIHADFSELERRLDFIKWCISKALPPAKDSQIANERAYVYYKVTKPTVIEDENLIPPEFIEVVRQPDRRAIKRCIESGGQVPGARLDVNYSPQIKPGGIRAMRAAEKRLKKLAEGGDVDGDL